MLPAVSFTNWFCWRQYYRLCQNNFNYYPNKFTYTHMSLFATTSKDHYQQSIYLIQFCKQYWTSPTFWPSSVGTLLTQLSPAITPPPLSGLFYFQSPRLFSSVSSVANCRLPFFKHFLWSTGDTLFLLFSSFRKRKTYRTFWRHHSGALISSKKKVPLNALFLFFFFQSHAPLLLCIFARQLAQLHFECF